MNKQIRSTKLKSMGPDELDTYMWTAEKAKKIENENIMVPSIISESLFPIKKTTGTRFWN